MSSFPCSFFPSVFLHSLLFLVRIFLSIFISTLPWDFHYLFFFRYSLFFSSNFSLSFYSLLIVSIASFLSSLLPFLHTFLSFVSSLLVLFADAFQLRRSWGPRRQFGSSVVSFFFFLHSLSSLLLPRQRICNAIVPGKRATIIVKDSELGSITLRVKHGAPDGNSSNGVPSSRTLYDDHVLFSDHFFLRFPLFSTLLFLLLLLLKDTRKFIHPLCASY